MPQFIQTIDSNSNFAVCLEPACKELLHSLSKLTRSHVVVLRTVDPVIRKLELMMFDWRKDCGFDLTTMDVPESKSISDWIGSSPDQSIGGVTSGSNCGDHSYRSEKEQAFVDWIGAKAYFPVHLNERHLLFVLIRGKPCRPYRREDVLLAWIHAQSVISDSAGDEGAEHSHFCEVMKSVEFLMNQDYRAEGKFDQAILHLMTSGSGVGWNRAFLFRSNVEASGLATCVAAVGEVNKERWLEKMVRKTRRNLLQGELKDAVNKESFRQDSLWQAAKGLELQQEPLESNASNEDSWSLSLLTPVTDSCSRFMNQALGNRAHDFQSSEDYVGTRFRVGNETYFAIFSHLYLDPKLPPSPILTCAILFYLLDAKARISSADDMLLPINESQSSRLAKFVEDFEQGDD